MDNESLIAPSPLLSAIQRPSKNEMCRVLVPLKRQESITRQQIELQSSSFWHLLFAENCSECPMAGPEVCPLCQ